MKEKAAWLEEKRKRATETVSRKKKELERTSFAAFTQNLTELEEKLKKEKEEEAK